MQGSPPPPKTQGLERGDHRGAHRHGAGWMPGQQIQGKGKGAARNKGISRLC